MIVVIDFNTTMMYEHDDCTNREPWVPGRPSFSMSVK